VSLASVAADLDVVQSQLDEYRHDDTTASQCLRLTEARDLVRRALALVCSVERDQTAELDESAGAGA
jgi:hypothetical protein